MYTSTLQINVRVSGCCCQSPRLNRSTLFTKAKHVASAGLIVHNGGSDTHPNRRNAHADDNALFGKGGQVGGQAEVSAVVGQQHAVAHGTQRLNALDERLFLDATIPVGPVQ